MINKLRVRAQSESGFTLVELLVVMLILGLLAAIAIPAFFNQRDKAADAEAKSTAKTTQTAMETYATDNNGKYTGATVALLQEIEPTIPDAPVVALVPAPTDTGYSIDVSSTVAGQAFSIYRTAGALSYPCTASGKGGCPAGGWGG